MSNDQVYLYCSTTEEKGEMARFQATSDLYKAEPIGLVEDQSSPVFVVYLFARQLQPVTYSLYFPRFFDAILLTMTVVTPSASSTTDEVQQDSSFEWKTLVDIGQDPAKYQELVQSILRWWVLSLSDQQRGDVLFLGKICLLVRS